MENQLHSEQAKQNLLSLLRHHNSTRKEKQESLPVPSSKMISDASSTLTDRPRQDKHSIHFQHPTEIRLERRLIPSQVLDKRSAEPLFLVMVQATKEQCSGWSKERVCGGGQCTYEHKSQTKMPA